MRNFTYKNAIKGVILALLFVGNVFPVISQAQQIAYSNPDNTNANGSMGVQGYLTCPQNGGNISRIDLLIYDNRSTSTPFYVNNVSYGNVTFINTATYRWVTVASGTIPCTSATTTWYFRGNGGMTLPTYYSGTISNWVDNGSPIMWVNGYWNTSNVFSAVSPVRRMAAAYYYSSPSVTVNVTASSSGSGGSSATSTFVYTENDQIINFAILFMIFFITALGTVIMLKPLYVRK